MGLQETKRIRTASAAPSAASIRSSILGLAPTPAAEEVQEGEQERVGAQRGGGQSRWRMTQGRQGRARASRRVRGVGEKRRFVDITGQYGHRVPQRLLKNLPDIIVRHAPRPPSTVYSACMRCFCCAPQQPHLVPGDVHEQRGQFVASRQWRGTKGAGWW